MRKSFTYDGTRHFIRCEDETDFEVKKALLIEKLDQGKVIITKNTSVSDWADMWLKTYKKGTVAEGTYEDYKLIVSHIKRNFGGTKLKDVKPVHCQDILMKYADSGKSKSFIDKLSNTMSQIFRQAIKNQLMYDNPAEGLSKPKAKEGSHRPISDQERSLILKIAETHHAGPWIKTMLYCGLRPKETTLVLGKDVDIKKRILHVRGTKTFNANRIVPVPDVLISDLTGVNPNSYVFSTASNTALTKRRIYHWWTSFKREMNLELGAETFRNKLLEDKLPTLKDNPDDMDLTLYCLRHTYCTDLQNAGVPINVAKDLMGHSDISITAKIYTHQSDISFQSAAEKINNYSATPNKKT